MQTAGEGQLENSAARGSPFVHFVLCHETKRILLVHVVAEGVRR